MRILTLTLLFFVTDRQTAINYHSMSILFKVPIHDIVISKHFTPKKKKKTERKGGHGEKKERQIDRTLTPMVNLYQSIHPTSMSLDCRWKPEGPGRKPTHAQREHANFAKKDQSRDSKPQPSCCETTAK